MTYLNIMNNVLRRLREEEVNSVNDSTYSKMAGDFINDAKTIVEQAADWSALRDTILVNTVASGYEVGDISQSGDITGFDKTQYSNYVLNANTNAQYVAYIEDTLLPWAYVNMAEYGPGTLAFADAIDDAADYIEPASSLLRTYIAENKYSLTGSGDDVKIMSVVNTTDNVFMDYQTKDWFNDQMYNNNSYTEGSCRYYTFNGLDANGDTQVLIYPRPDSQRTQLLRFNVVKRQADLSLDGDELLIPEKPVIHLAVALLARERGETGGTSTAEYFTIADKYLSDAIAIDAAKHPEEMIFRTI